VVLVVVGMAGAVLDWGADTAHTVPTASSSPSAPPPSSPAPTEDAHAFFDAFETAVRTGDRGFLLARLHPVVIERYGQSQCEAFVAQLVDPTVDLQLVSVEGPATFDYASDGLSTPVPDTYVFNVDGTATGRAGPRQYHLALVNGAFRTFSDCGTPVSGASS